MNAPFACELLESRQLLATLTYGEVFDGTIGQRGEIDVHRFNVREGSRIELAINSRQAEQGFRAFARLIQPGGAVIANIYANSSSSNLKYDLTVGGVYRLQVMDDGLSDKGSYSIGLEGLNPISPKPISLIKGGIVSGSIGRQLEKDQFVFRGIRGNIFDLGITSTAIQAGFRSYAQLISPSGIVEKEFWANSSSAVQRISLQESGRYMLEIADSDLIDTGRYTVGLEGIKAISPGNVNLQPGKIRAGQVSAPLDKRQYTFIGKSEDVFELAVTSTAVESGFRTFAELFKPSGELFKTFYANSSSEDQRFSLPQDGTYMVQISDDDLRERGTFTVGLEGIKPASNGAIALIKGNVVNARISSTIDKKQYLIAAKVGDVVDIAITSEAIDAGFRTYGKLFAPSGALVNQFYADSSSENQRMTLDQNGTYVLQISDDDLRQRGRFSVGLEGISPVSSEPIVLKKGEIVTGKTTAAIDKKQYVFWGAAGQTVNLAIADESSAAGYRAFAELFSPKGVSIRKFWTRSSTADQRFTLSARGNYMLQISDDDLRQTGTFRVSLDGISPPNATATNLAKGSTLTRSLTDPLQRQQFTISRQKGQSFSLDVRSDSGGPDFRASYEVVEPGGRSLGTYLADSVTQFIANRNGKYLILVHDYNFDAVGRFRIRWT